MIPKPCIVAVLATVSLTNGIIFYLFTTLIVLCVLFLKRSLDTARKLSSEHSITIIISGKKLMRISGKHTTNLLAIIVNDIANRLAFTHGWNIHAATSRSMSKSSMYNVLHLLISPLL